MKLKGQVAIVTGAGRNIGEEVAKLLSKEGAAIAVVDLDKGRAEKVAADINAAGGKAKAFICDVAKEADIDATVGFFQSRGFDISASNSIAATLLSQSKIENVNVFQIIDTLKGLNDLQLSRVVSEILNYNRLNISTLGYKVDTAADNQFEIRNVRA